MTIKPIDLWKGKFGDDYSDRNPITAEDIENRKTAWVQIIALIHNSKKTPYIFSSSFFEMGAGTGRNIISLHKLYIQNNMPGPKLFAEEPNDRTRAVLIGNAKEIGANLRIVNEKEKMPSGIADITFTSGVLIHIPPNELIDQMKELYRLSKKYIVIMEYFSPELREIQYHGEKALWLNDFGSIMLDNFGVTCLSCGFFWKRTTGLDNLTYWIFEKVN